MKGALGSISQDEKIIINRKVFQGEKEIPFYVFFICAKGGDFGIIYGTQGLNRGRPAQPHLRPHDTVQITGSWDHGITGSRDHGRGVMNFLQKKF